MRSKPPYANLDVHLTQPTRTAEARRDAALREIDRHREGFGQRLRRAINRVEDAEFRVIEPPVEQDAA